MTNKEINETVAQNLGWTKNMDSTTVDHWHTPKIPGKIGTECHEQLPDFCGDITAAWIVAEKCPMALVPLSNRHWYATTMGMPGTEGECFEIWAQTNCVTKDGCSCGRCVVADAAPMAICLAFLKSEVK